MRARIAESRHGLLVFALASFLVGCSNNASSITEILEIKEYRYSEESAPASQRPSEEQIIKQQYELLYHGGIDVVINKRVDLCDYNKLLYMRVSNHSTWLTDPVRNSVMKNFNRGNRFFKSIRTSEPVAYINATPYPPIPIGADQVVWYSENDPVTLAWLDRFVKEDRYIVGDAILNETNIDAGLLRNYSFELKLLDSDDGAVIVEFINRRASLNTKPEAVIAHTISRVNNWLERVERICEERPAPKPQPPENCGYEK